jgi:hypothetical protein
MATQNAEIAKLKAENSLIKTEVASLRSAASGTKKKMSKPSAAAARKDDPYCATVDTTPQYLLAMNGLDQDNTRDPPQHPLRSEKDEADRRRAEQLDAILDGLDERNESGIAAAEAEEHLEADDEDGADAPTL